MDLSPCPSRRLGPRAARQVLLPLVGEGRGTTEQATRRAPREAASGKRWWLPGPPGPGPCPPFSVPSRQAGVSQGVCQTPCPPGEDGQADTTRFFGKRDTPVPWVAKPSTEGSPGFAAGTPLPSWHLSRQSQELPVLPLLVKALRLPGGLRTSGTPRDPAGRVLASFTSSPGCVFPEAGESARRQH